MDHTESFPQFVLGEWNWVEVNSRGNFEREKKTQNGRFKLETYKHLPLFFQMPSYPFFMMIVGGGYEQHVLTFVASPRHTTTIFFSLVVVSFRSMWKAVKGLSERLRHQLTWVPILASLPAAYVTLETLLNVCYVGGPITTPILKTTIVRIR